MEWNIIFSNFCDDALLPMVCNEHNIHSVVVRPPAPHPGTVHTKNHFKIIIKSIGNIFFPDTMKYYVRHQRKKTQGKQAKRRKN